MRFGAMFGLFIDTGPFCSWWSPGMMKWRTTLFPILETAIPDVPLSATGLCALIIHKWVDYDNVCIINFFRYTTVQRFGVSYIFIFMCVAFFNESYYSAKKHIMTVKTFEKICFKEMLFFWHFLVIKEFWKKSIRSHKNIKQRNCFQHW